MSDLLIVNQADVSLRSHPLRANSCRANLWLQITTGVLAMMAFGAFSALRAYALSNRNMWLTAVIFLLAIPPSAMAISVRLQRLDVAVPHAFHEVCFPLSILFEHTNRLMITPSSINVVWRVSQFAAELLVISITWWYTYRSYRIRKGIKLGKTISSLLIYNGSLYFLFLATLYILGIIVNTTSILGAVGDATSNLGMFYDPIAAILTCRFMLSLRRFDSTISSPTYFATGSRLRGQAASTMLQFAAPASDTLPAFIASFAHPVYVDSSFADHDALVDDDDRSEWREMDAVARSPDSEGTVLSESGF
ncbi:hypothetical protein GSI_04955 [Ganoderma sinense ZZ0214-1]|uniref:Uncharacterized protein n=1 Tax=Ganoderma sinense ZZ0214-1 TaxID=1077348 RepID=A0A2G8SGZ3_9APHY|nr:hypothetical protein GSI_04955 [Ganoderma sinense ZZ0214-1]